MQIFIEDLDAGYIKVCEIPLGDHFALGHAIYEVVEVEDMKGVFALCGNLISRFDDAYEVLRAKPVEVINGKYRVVK